MARPPGAAQAGAAGGDVTTGHPADAGRAIATLCTALAQWFRPGGPRTREQIAREYATFALRRLGGPANGSFSMAAGHGPTAVAPPVGPGARRVGGADDLTL